VSDQLQTKPTIVFLDDEEPILASLRSLVRREDYAPHFFHSGSEAVAFLERNTADVIVTDMRMPEMNGAEFLKRATLLCPTAVRIMLSGHEDKAVVINALSDGLAQYYILKPWDDTGFKSLIRQALRLPDQRLKEVFASSNAVPSRPKSHVRLLEMLSKEECSLKDIVEEIESSPTLVAKLLRVANSVYFATRAPITTVHEAATFVGVKYIVNLVMAIESIQTVCKGLDATYNHFIEEIWNVSLHRAAIAKAIGERWKGFNNGHLVYITSLLQDIGYVVRLCNEPKKYVQLIEQSKAHALSRYEAEKEVFTILHDEVGAALLEYWNFPPEIVSAIEQHHRMAGDRTLVQILQVAGSITSADFSDPHDPAIEPLIVEWRERLEHQLPTTRRATSL
jgi:HD-like signal output (HDOD) protein